ncbi:hypothetical protein NDU88_000764 [Pleurodeles waltl]|uniref:Uncharacterized protein n=1 Tax=Pleurodeles waltl TaxID=8319 RepID=A0AAV7S7W9_PLEWA|nr:hypothetical protein NDU88_000764 [Pleurodeles waltl]
MPDLRKTVPDRGKEARRDDAPPEAGTASPPRGCGILAVAPACGGDGGRARSSNRVSCCTRHHSKEKRDSPPDTLRRLQSPKNAPPRGGSGPN